MTLKISRKVSLLLFNIIYNKKLYIANEIYKKNFVNKMAYVTIRGVHRTVRKGKNDKYYYIKDGKRVYTRAMIKYGTKPKSVRKSTRKSRKTQRKSTRKSRKSTRKSTRKSRKTQRKSTRKSRKTQRKSTRKSRKTQRKSIRKSRKTQRKSTRKSPNESSKIVKDPVPEKYRNLREHGIIGETDEKKKDLYYMDSRFGELFDAYQIVNANKPTAAMDFSKSARQRLKRKFGKTKINDWNNMIRYLRSKGVMMISTDTKKKLSYLKSAFYIKGNKKSYDNALKLLDAIHYPGDLFSPEIYDVSIGILLGYKNDNIKAFVERNYGYPIFDKEIDAIKKMLEKKIITLDILNSKDNSVTFKEEEIPLLEIRN